MALHHRLGGQEKTLPTLHFDYILTNLLIFKVI